MRNYFFCKGQFSSIIQFCILSRDVTSKDIGCFKITQNSKTIRVDFMVRCPDLSVLGYETNEIKQVIKEPLLLFSRNNVILNKQVKSILIELFLGIFITYDSSSVSFSIICSSMLVFKICKLRFLSMSCDRTKARITLLRRKKTTCFWFYMLKVSLKKVVSNLQTLPSSNVFSNISVPTLKIKKSIN